MHLCIDVGTVSHIIVTCSLIDSTVQLSLLGINKILCVELVGGKQR